MNSAILMGRLTADPELRTTNSNLSFIRFTIAVDRPFQKAGEERQADFITCIAWRQNADFISKYFRKGQMIAVQGSIQTGSYEDKSGNKRTAFDVLVDKAHFCGSKSASPSTTFAQTAPVQTSIPDISAPDFNDDDLPF